MEPDAAGAGHRGGATADAVRRAMANPGISGVFNVGSGYSPSIVELAASIKKILGGDGPEIRFDDGKPEDTSVSLMDSSKAAKAFDWRARYTFEAAIENMKHERESGLRGLQP